MGIQYKALEKLRQAEQALNHRFAGRDPYGSREYSEQAEKVADCWIEAIAAMAIELDMPIDDVRLSEARALLSESINDSVGDEVVFNGWETVYA